MSLAIAEETELNLNERLRMEFGWNDVAKGLTQILCGYVAFFLGVAIGGGLIFIAIYGLSDDFGRRVVKPTNATFWKLYIGLGILSVIGLISYTIIVGGQFKCMLHSSERHGARWFMFMSIACLFLGPAFEVATGIANWQAISELKKNPGKLQDFQLNPMGQWLHLIAFGICMLYPLCFTLFMRAIAVCLRADGHVMLINVFLLFKAFLVAATGYALYRHPPGGTPIPHQEALMLGLAWGVLLLVYFALFAVMRVCINTVMGQVRSPLEMQHT